MLEGKSILITGGTGSLGTALTRRIFKEYPNVKRVVIFSRDEQKQFQMAQEFQKSLNIPLVISGGSRGKEILINV
jgi:UDP-N-acetylglucosamine 4,6-dehydratase